MKILRAFPRRTNATPTDELAHIGKPDLFSGSLDIDKVHISVTFSWDLPEAEAMEKEWRKIAPVEMGGPALGQAGGDFTPGMYLKKGYVITSRGCPNRCWFCSVWRREGAAVRELPVTDGYNVLDDNLLSCSEEHIRGVFSMLQKQKRQPHFTGGLEAARLQEWHVEELVKLNPRQMFFAYDTPDDYDPLVDAGRMLRAAGFKRKHPLRAYVLVGYPGDTFEQAERRLISCYEAGFMPMAMLYHGENGERDRRWVSFVWPWSRPAIIDSKVKQLCKEGTDGE